MSDLMRGDGISGENGAKFISNALQTTSYSNTSLNIMVLSSNNIRKNGAEFISMHFKLTLL
jgi:hypothetical protein